MHGISCTHFFALHGKCDWREEPQKNFWRTAGMSRHWFDGPTIITQVDNGKENVIIKIKERGILQHIENHET